MHTQRLIDIWAHETRVTFTDFFEEDQRPIKHQKHQKHQKHTGTALHPLEQHNGSRIAESRGLKWTSCHALALQAYEGLHVGHADAWKVPAAGGLLVQDTVAPPVANVTCIYGDTAHEPRTRD